MTKAWMKIQAMGTYHGAWDMAVSQQTHSEGSHMDFQFNSPVISSVARFVHSSIQTFTGLAVWEALEETEKLPLGLS